jgi:D-sedoheptulose 7-phosphate isomerase
MINLKFKKINNKELIYSNFKESVNVKMLFLKDTNNIENLSKIINIIIKKISLGGKIYFAGNGGSASDSIHLSTELISKLSKERKPIPSGDLVSNISLLTAISNDFSYDKIFIRQIQSNLTRKDIFFAISTSGNSKNIIGALKECKKKKILSILLTGKKGGKAKNFVDSIINVPSNKTQTIQEVHLLIGHCICDSIEKALI